ncbi:MAG: SpoIID/LytB domain-containing protein [Peptoclostridium sp.]|uniref:SpoIID/LytB domain-containing protein n=1 Tax=Peptoclostridium sp. TaxID=1904860 RepID=UPI00139DCF92|nr:SpoIID/LytB domain-containing protein [Peptoclostridium sp.]MZQ76147.1 SpoIID/LytB domain-containing protein [Peptoclostridium sp.]
MSKKLIRAAVAAIMALAILALPLSGTSHAATRQSVPEYINVGLRFGSSAAQTLAISSQDELKVRETSGSSLANLGEEQAVLSKDTAPYHIELDGSFDTFNDAIRELQDMDIEEGYAYYDGNWKIYIGSYASSDDANTYAQELYEQFGGEYTFEAVAAQGRNINVSAGSGDIIMSYDAGKGVQLESASGYPVSVDGKKYRGAIICKRLTTGDMTVINRIKLEEYLYGVVPKEMSGGWPVEALKAQAIAARNYTAISLGKHSGQGFDICTTTDCQVYGGYDSEAKNSNAAVDETAGRLMTYDGSLVQAFYHSNSGGMTENSENVWSAKLPYLRGVSDEFSLGAPNDSWSVALSSDQLQTLLAGSSVDIGELIGVNVAKKSENGRVLELEVVGSQGSKTIQKESIRKVIGYNTLKSTYFDLQTSNGAQQGVKVISASGIKSLDTSEAKVMSYAGDKISWGTIAGTFVQNSTKKAQFTISQEAAQQYVFNGRGWGHGLGMSQWGAKKMADSGYSYIDILKHYYTGVEIE